MNIGFSAFVMQGGKSGVAAYIKSLFSSLQKFDSENNYDLLISRKEEDLVPLSKPNFQKSVYPSFIANPVVNLAWHNSLLPLITKKKGFDLIHIPSYRRIPLVKGVKTVATVHDLATFALDAKYDQARMFFNRKIVPSMIRRANHVITVSNYTKRDIVDIAGYPEEKITVIYSGINTDLFSATPKSEARTLLAERHGLDKPFFVYLSRLEHPAKNHIRLISAFEKFKDRNETDHQLVFAGADWNGARKIRARAKESAFASEIHFLGFVSLESIPLLYSGCDLMVYPSLFEGFGFPILEAMACGANVVCSNTSSMQEIASDIAPTFDPEAVEDMLARMEEALGRDWDEPRRRKAIDYATSFRWEDTARKVVDVYRKVVDHG